MKKVWTAIKGFVMGFLTNSVKTRIFEAIDSLDQYEDDLAEAINKAAKVEERSKAAIDFVQKKLKEIVEKVI